MEQTRNDWALAFREAFGIAPDASFANRARMIEIVKDVYAAFSSTPFLKEVHELTFLPLSLSNIV